MGNRKLSQSSVLTQLANDDLLMALDVSDNTDGEGGTNKKIAVSNLRTEMQDGMFDGDYNSLENKPTLFSGNYSDLTNKPMTVSLSVGDTAPSSPSENDLWVDTSSE